MSWPLVKLGDLYAKRLPSVDPSRFEDEEFDLFSVPAYSNRIPDQVFGADIGSSKVEVHPGDVLVCKIVPHIRRAWVVPPGSERRQIASGEWIVLRGDQFDSNYLRHFLLCDSFHARFMSTVAGVGGSLVRARPAFAAGIDIPLPPLPEQRRIASILDQADALRSLSSRAAEASVELSTAVFVQMFGDAVGNPKHWRTERLSDLGKVVTGSTPPRSVESNYGGVLEWIKSDNITPPVTYLSTARETLSDSGRSGARIVGDGSILVTCIAGSLSSIGNSALANRDVAFNQQINAFTPEGLLPRYALAHFRQGKRLVQEKSTGGMKGIVSKSRFEKIRFMVPPIELQQEFEAVSALIETMGCYDELHLAKLDELFASLQHRAFRGEL